jgi:hypothetical protein
MPITPLAFADWVAKLGTMPEPTKGKYLKVVAAGHDDFEEVASLGEADLRRAIESLPLGSAGKNIIVNWFLNRTKADDSSSLAHSAIELATSADTRGLVGRQKEDFVDKGLSQRARALPRELGDSPYCQVLYVMGNDSSKLGKDGLTFTPVDGNVKALDEEEGRLVVKGGKAWAMPEHTASPAAFLEWEAANKRACYRHNKDPLVEQINLYDLFIQQLGSISWGLAMRYHWVFMTENEGRLATPIEDPARFLRVMLVWQAEGQPAAPPPNAKWTLATAKHSAVSSGSTLEALREEVRELKAMRFGGGGGADASALDSLRRRLDRVEGRLANLSSDNDVPSKGKDRECYECGETGHIGRDCPVRKARRDSASAAASASSAAAPAVPGQV